MNNNGSTWEKYHAPYDPRQVDGAITTEDDHGRIVEIADCGIRCPGCGICCQEYRDEITPDYRGVEEFRLNLQSVIQPGRMVSLGKDWVYHAVQCGPACPGYEKCCPPADMRQHPDRVAQAQAILLDRDESTLVEIQEALLFLAHDGTEEAVTALERYMPIAHTRVAGFAECALEEGQYFNSIPRSDEERVLMLKREVQQQYEDQICEAQAEIDEDLLPEIERLEYELEIVRRVAEKSMGTSEEEDWQIQVSTLEMVIGTKQGRLEELRAEINRNETVFAEIERDIV